MGLRIFLAVVDKKKGVRRRRALSQSESLKDSEKSTNGGLLEGYKATSHWLSLDLLKLFGVETSKDRIVIGRNRITGGDYCRNRFWLTDGFKNKNKARRKRDTTFNRI